MAKSVINQQDSAMVNVRFLAPCTRTDGDQTFEYEEGQEVEFPGHRARHFLVRGLVELVGESQPTGGGEPGSESPGGGEEGDGSKSKQASTQQSPEKSPAKSPKGSGAKKKEQAE